MFSFQKGLLALSSFFGAALVVFGGLWVDSTYANHDYVCSNYTSACSCTWESGWRADGSKHCPGTKTAVTRYGNTRVGCPSGAYGSVALGYNGGFLYGDEVTTVTCEKIVYDTLPPIVDAQGQAITESGGVIGYRNSTCVGDYCYFKKSDCVVMGNSVSCNGPLYSLTELQNLSFGRYVPARSGNIFSSLLDSANAATSQNYSCSGSGCKASVREDVVVGYKYTASCKDNRSQFDTSINKFGDSGCKTMSQNSTTIKVGEVFKFEAEDKAGNKSTCTVDGTKTTCSRVNTRLGIGEKLFDDVSTCNYGGGGSCKDDKTPPIAEITYNPDSCTNQDVVVTNRCVSDGPDGSGCRSGDERAPTLILRSNQAGTLGVADVAGNVTDLAYSVDWIDKVAPTNASILVSSQVAGNNVATIAGLDTGAPGCTLAGIRYAITIQGPENKVVTGTIPKNGTPTAVPLDIQKSGSYTFSLQLTDEAGNQSTSVTANATIYPGAPGNSLLALQDQNGTKYADGSEMYTYKLTLKDTYGNPIFGKSLTNVAHDWEESGVKTIKTDMTNPEAPTGDLAIFGKVDAGARTDEQGNILFTVKANAPGVFTERFKISMYTWNGSYENTSATMTFSVASNAQNSFRRPFMGSLSVTDLANPHLLVGTTTPMKLTVTKKATGGTFAGKVVEDFSTHLKLTQTAHHALQNISAIANTDTNPTFSIRINSISSQGTSIAPGIVINPSPAIRYSLNGQTIRYMLAKNDSGVQNEYIDYIETVAFQGLKVVGIFQGNGKLEEVGFGTNATDLSKNELRNNIRKNGFNLIAGATSGQVTARGVFYKEGNYTLTSVPAGANTIVIKNGNLTIANDIVRQGAGLGIIVMNDVGGNAGGNIYIKPDVRNISALIYADKSLMSADQNGTPYTSDSATRTKTLEKQLILKGSLFTSNTIGGAILGTSGQYVLPGGKATTNFDEAMTYDLNYIRRGTVGCDLNGNAICTDSGEYNAPFVIEYNGANTTNPPPGFDSVGQ